VKRSITLTGAPIDEAALVASRTPSGSAGAVVCFSGCVRGREADRRIEAIDYEAFPAMVHRQFEAIFDAAEQRWPLESVEVVHRTGRVATGEPSLWIRVTSPHRAEALAACGWIIDEMKRVVPIWKRPLWGAGRGG
jgi:molybdopterin synthase catalytic subunit